MAGAPAPAALTGGKLTRVFVPPIKERFGELKGITGATMEDGTVYRSRRGGVMNVDRQDHIDAMKRDPRVAEFIAVEGFNVKGHAGAVCPQCGFAAWRWQDRCPKDGTDLRGDDGNA